MRHSLVQKKKSWFRSLGMTFALLLFVVVGIIAGVRAFLKQREAVIFRDQYARELEELVLKEKSLNEKIGRFAAEAGIEAEVRSRYRVVKPGEQLVLVVDNDPGTVAQSSPLASWWGRFRDFLGL